jgi:predicted dehydrogenase
MEQQSLRWGILGCGDVTEFKSGPAFSKVKGSELVAVMRRDTAKAEDYARRHHVPVCHSDAEKLIQDPSVDAVYIATPPASHMSLALAVAAAGKPCYVEKPMARTSQECETMVKAFDQAGRKLAVAYYRRSLPHFQYVKGLIDSGELGPVRQLEYAYRSGAMCDGKNFLDWRFDPEVSGGGLFWDLGSHALDLFDYWLGPLEQISGHALNITKRTEVEESVSMIAVAQENISFSASWNFMSQQSRDEVEITFERGRVQCSVFGASLVKIHYWNGEMAEKSFELPENIQTNLIQNVTDYFCGRVEPLSTGESALRTNRVIDTVAK